MLFDLAQELKKQFPEELLEFLRTAGELARAQGQNLYLVGGVVRDLLLGRPTLDLDFVVEGDAPSLAHHLAETKGGRVVARSPFGTAKLKWRTLSFDLATARSETYAKPGVLPQVKPSTIFDDLLRRDFTINAMAIKLNPAHFGELIDPYGGKSDLDQGLIRVLHPKSFSDDPTRILRALRYEQRLHFRLEQNTEELLRRNIDFMNEVTGERLRHELELILKENCPEQVLRRADELGVLHKLHPSLKGDGWMVERFTQARKMSGDFRPEPLLYWALLVYRLEEKENESLIACLKIAGRAAQVMRDVFQVKCSFPDLTQPGLSASSIYRKLERFSPEAIQACAIASDSPLVRQRLELYLTDLRYVKPSLTGNELRKMGVPPGKQLGQMLEALREARLDQKVKSREEEKELVRRWLAFPFHPHCRQ